MSLQSWVTVLKDVVNIGFFAVVAAVTVLTYRRARETLFTPLRTEVFKVQLKEIGDAFALLRSVDTEARKVFDLETVVYLNAQRMMDVYAETVFPGRLKRADEYEQSWRKLRYASMMSREAAEKLLAPPLPKRSGSKPPGLALPSWAEYEHLMVDHTKTYAEQTAELMKFAKSPFLPKELREIFEVVGRLVHQSLMAVGEVMGSAAKDLPSHYASPEDVQKSDLSWIWNLYIKSADVDSVSVAARQGIEFIEEYLGSNSLVERRRRNDKQALTRIR